MRLALIVVAIVLVAPAAHAEPLNCSMTGYKAQPGLAAAVAEDTLTVTWDGDRNQEVRLRFAINGGTPTIRDIYSSSPVSYVKLDTLPTPQDLSPVIETLMRGDYLVTSGEVLIPSYSLLGTGNQRTIEVDVEWTFPLEFVEVVWGDGTKTDRQIVSATDLPPMGRHRFQLPFNAEGKKWVRFAAWDTAGNGAMAQPIKLSRPMGTAAGR